MPAIITENDESKWQDDTGIVYHFPKRYEKYLLPQTEVIYYKGGIKKKIYRQHRLCDEPHYFAKAVIGKVFKDRQSSKGDLFATIESYSPFSAPVLAKQDNGYFESIPENRLSNYWRDGVRPISQAIYTTIASQIDTRQIAEADDRFRQTPQRFNDIDNSLESTLEGSTSSRYITAYERNPRYRKQAIAIHGTSCVACGFNFGEFYGDYAKDFIHIHHLVPVSKLQAPKAIDPETDLVPLCANCHSVVHRRKDKTITIDELKQMIEHMARPSSQS